MTPHSQEQLTQTLFEESGDAHFLFDLDTEQILNVNPMAEQLCGFTRQELLRTQASGKGVNRISTNSGNASSIPTPETRKYEPEKRDRR